MQSELETITIRRMEPQDVDGIIAIEEKAYGDHHWSKESFLNELNNENKYVLHLLNIF